MKTHDLFAAPEATDRLGQNLAGLLTEACGELPHDLTQRLRVARQQALAVRKPESAPAHQVIAHDNSLTLAGPPSEGLGLWSIMGSSLPLLALLAGLVAVQWWDGETTVSELAEVDTALLADDLPPAAYSDPGFIRFLRQGGAEPHTQD